MTTYSGALTGNLVVVKVGSGTLTLSGPQAYGTLATGGGITNLNASFTGGTATVNAGATLNINASQNLAALNIGAGVEVTFGDGLSFAAAPEKSDAPALVPEPGALGLLFAGAFGVIASVGLRRWSVIVVASAVTVAGVILTAGVSMFPFIMPSSSVPDSSLTAWDAVSSWRTLQIMFWVTVFFVPLIALYTSWVYAKLRGTITLETIRSEE